MTFFFSEMYGKAAVSRHFYINIEIPFYSRIRLESNVVMIMLVLPDSACGNFPLDIHIFCLVLFSYWCYKFISKVKSLSRMDNTVSVDFSLLDEHLKAFPNHFWIQNYEKVKTLRHTESFLGSWEELRDNVDDGFNHVPEIVDNSGSVCLNRS